MDDKTVSAWLVLNWATIVGFLIGSFFGLLRHAQDFVSGPADARPKFSWWVAVIKAATAGGVGTLVAWLCREWNVSANMSAFMIALAGWGGVETMNTLWMMMIDGLRRRLGNDGATQNPPNAGPKV